MGSTIRRMFAKFLITRARKEVRRLEVRLARAKRKLDELELKYQ